MTTHDGHRVSGNRPGRILDLCVAPGGFLGIAMRLHPECEALASSFPTSKRWIRYSP